jgi:uncharacterized membrane protein YidH (DUF202 family)
MLRGRGGGEGVRTRDHLANSRILQAWFRATLALVAIGYALEKLRVVAGEAGQPGTASLFHLGRWIVLAGMGFMALALLRFLLHRREIEGAAFQPRLAADAVLLVAVGLSGLAALVFLVVIR